MITKEEIINDWSITPEDIRIFYHEVGESLTDIGDLGGFTFCEFLESSEALMEDIGQHSKKGVDNLLKLKHLYNPKFTTLIPPDEILLICCIAKNYYLDIIKKAADLTNKFYLNRKIFEDSNFEEDNDLQYVSSYDMMHFLENESIWDDDTSDKFIEMLCYAINKCQQIKINWYILLSYYK